MKTCCECHKSEPEVEFTISKKYHCKNCVGKSKSSGGFIWSKIKKENIYE